MKESSSESTKVESLRKATPLQSLENNVRPSGSPASSKRGLNAFVQNFRGKEGKPEDRAETAHSLERKDLRSPEPGGTPLGERPEAVAPARKGRSKSLEVADWRQLFEEAELAAAYAEIRQGAEPNEREKELSEGQGSDENASEDNFDLRELYKEVYLREHLMEREIERREKAASEARREFQRALEESEARALAEVRRQLATQESKEES